MKGYLGALLSSLEKPRSEHGQGPSQNCTVELDGLEAGEYFTSVA